MVSGLDLAAAAAGAAAVLALALAAVAVLAWRATRSPRSLLLAAAFAASAVQALVTAYLLVTTPGLPVQWVAVPLAHVVVLLLMYAALLRR